MLLLPDEQVFVFDEGGEMVKVGAIEVFFDIVAMKWLYFHLLPKGFQFIQCSVTFDALP